jgi:hypothetical protein
MPEELDFTGDGDDSEEHQEEHREEKGPDPENEELDEELNELQQAVEHVGDDSSVEDRKKVLDDIDRFLDDLKRDESAKNLVSQIRGFEKELNHLLSIVGEKDPDTRKHFMIQLKELVGKINKVSGFLVGPPAAEPHVPPKPQPKARGVGEGHEDGYEPDMVEGDPGFWVAAGMEEDVPRGRDLDEEQYNAVFDWLNNQYQHHNQGKEMDVFMMRWTARDVLEQPVEMDTFLHAMGGAGFSLDTFMKDKQYDVLSERLHEFSRNYDERPEMKKNGRHFEKTSWTPSNGTQKYAPPTGTRRAAFTTPWSARTSSETNGG